MADDKVRDAFNRPNLLLETEKISSDGQYISCIATKTIQVLKTPLKPEICLENCNIFSCSFLSELILLSMCKTQI